MSEYIVSTDDLQPDGTFSREREEIVRCRDCAYICNREYANGLEFHTCSYFDSEHAEVEPDGFCKWGERMDA